NGRPARIPRGPGRARATASSGSVAGSSTAAIPARRRAPARARVRPGASSTATARAAKPASASTSSTARSSIPPTRPPPSAAAAAARGHARAGGRAPPAVKADIYVSPDAGGAGDRCILTHRAAPTDLLGIECFPLSEPVATLNAQDFEFDLPLPPRPPHGKL